MIVRRSTYDRSQELLDLERQVTKGMQASIDAKDKALKALSLELEQTKAALNASDSQLKSCRHSETRWMTEAHSTKETLNRTSAALDEMRDERDRALESVLKADERANNAATVIGDYENKLAASERSLDMSRSRREQIGKELDMLRSETMDLVEQASTTIRWLLAHSSGGSEADAQARLLRKACESVENLLNT